MTSLNGALHWLVADQGVFNEEFLLAFDLYTKKFLLYTTPFTPNVYLDRHLEVLGGYICFIVTDNRTYNQYNDVWLMKLLE